MSLTSYKVTVLRGDKAWRVTQVEACGVWAALALARVELLDGERLASAEGGGELVQVLGECSDCGRALYEVSEGEVSVRDEFEQDGWKVSCGPDCPARAA